MQLTLIYGMTIPKLRMIDPNLQNGHIELTELPAGAIPGNNGFHSIDRNHTQFIQKSKAYFARHAIKRSLAQESEGLGS